MSTSEAIQDTCAIDPYPTQDISHWNTVFNSTFDPRTIVWEIMKLGMQDVGKEGFYFQRDCRYDDWGTRLFISDGLAERIKKSMSKLEST